MFTGIVEELGTVRSLGQGPGGTRLAVACAKVRGDAAIGDSIAVSGVCLTVVERDEDGLAFDLASETLERTALGKLSAGDRVNLERPVTLGTRLGGHLVQGHVDGLGRIAEVLEQDASVRMRIEVPGRLARYLVEKGSVAVDGVSLTVASLEGETFDVALIPHTLEVTTLGLRAPGDDVHLEMDVLARYVERLMRRER